MKRTLKHAILIVFVLITTANGLLAQIFTSPVASSYQFGDLNVSRGALGTSCYSQANVLTGFNFANIYLSSWYNSTDAEFIFTILPTGGPSAGIFYRKGYPYARCRDLCVGYVQDYNTGKQNVLVAYYKQGIGHFLDIYNLTGSTTTPLVLDTTYTLSSTPLYGRITMDSHDPLTAVVIAWQRPGTGIQTIVCQAGNWSGITTLSGTLDEAAPDVAFSHSTGPLNAHYVYKNTTTGVVTTSSLDWPLLLTIPLGNTATMPPVIEDINTDPTVIASTSNMVIDCPDHYADEDWAYTYTDGMEVLVRLRYSGSLQTIHVNNGSLGNMSLVGRFFAHNPTINFSGLGGIYVGWYCRYVGGDSHYIGLRMSYDGSSLSSAPDYMSLPSFAAYSYPNSGVAFSKMNDFNQGICPQFMYTTYFTQIPGAPGTYMLNHAFHPWFNAFFGTGTGNTNRCTGAHKETPLIAQAKLGVYPNPFYNALATAITMNDAGTVELVLTDITGRRVMQRTKTLLKGEQMVRLDGLEQLTAGSYSLSIIVDGKNKGSQMVVKQK